MGEDHECGGGCPVGGEEVAAEEAEGCHDVVDMGAVCRIEQLADDRLADAHAGGKGVLGDALLPDCSVEGELGRKKRRNSDGLLAG